jgi:tetratricopeptide (TPR) repeat protein
MPLLFIYHGGLDELDRARFNPRYLKTLGNNIKLAQNEKILSTILSLPVASRLIYHPYPHVELNEQALPFPRDLSLEQSLKSLEYLYTLYQWEAMELTNYLRRKDANLWFIPQAYNLLERPSRNCIASGNIQIQNVLKDIEKLLDQKRSKEAVSKLLKIIQNETGHAETYYVLGKAFIKEGQYKKAKKAFYQALILDCDLKRSNPLMLKILMEEVEKKDFKVIDFNRLVTANLGRRLMFEGLRTPQRLYYERLVQELVKRFEQFIRNKE